MSAKEFQLVFNVDYSIYKYSHNHACRDVVITILSDKAQGMDAMRVCVLKPDSKHTAEITTPMRMLIEEMPG